MNIDISGFDPALRNVREAGWREAESRSSAENVAAECTMQHNGVNYTVMHLWFCEIYHLLDGMGVETRVPDAATRHSIRCNLICVLKFGLSYTILIIISIISGVLYRSSMTHDRFAESLSYENWSCAIKPQQPTNQPYENWCRPVPSPK
ncbi:hypothetical protein CDAR_607271 [Caerostris darwini]|uniref:Uncharacterized protein n=1 Tax=Caerostris darwini TaxID=1538125 RepID=A0AAV4NI54_9ARAC|nr:hypothetical protein CDAR_607271 [Caerostris darwini]